MWLFLWRAANFNILPSTFLGASAATLKSKAIRDANYVPVYSMQWDTRFSVDIRSLLIFRVISDSINAS